MKVEVLEEESDKLKIKIDTSLTLVNLLNDKIWGQKVEMSAYKMEHPYLAQPILLVRGKNPKKAVTEAASAIVDDVKEFRKQFAAATK